MPDNVQILCTDCSTLKGALQRLDVTELFEGAIIRTAKAMYALTDPDHRYTEEGYTVMSTDYNAARNDLDLGAFVSTGYNRNTVLTRTQRIVEAIKTYQDNFTIEQGFSNNAMEQDVNTDSPRYPIVCIINGAGGCGKDTFMEASNAVVAAAQTSSIDCVKELAQHMIDISDRADMFSEINAADEAANKTFRYRKALSQVKAAWTEFNNGPENIMLSNISDMLTDQINGGVAYDIIYAAIREPELIDRFRERVIGGLGLPCITLLIKSWIDPNQYDNDSDASVEDYPYDITVVNTYGKLDLFKLQAFTFGAVALRANQHYGIQITEIEHTDDTASSISEDKSDEPITKFQKHNKKVDSRFEC